MNKVVLAGGLFLLCFVAPSFCPAQDAAPAAPAPKTEKRLGRLEKKVEKIDKRVAKLEKTSAAPPPAAATAAPEKLQPLAVTLVSKKQLTKAGQLSVAMLLEFRNMLNYTINGFSGALVFKIEGERGVYMRKISYRHPLGPGDSAQIELNISSEETRQYLKFVRARAVNVAFVNQKLLEEAPQ